MRKIAICLIALSVLCMSALPVLAEEENSAERYPGERMTTWADLIRDDIPSWAYEVCHYAAVQTATISEMMEFDAFPQMDITGLEECYLKCITDTNLREPAYVAAMHWSCDTPDIGCLLNKAPSYMPDDLQSGIRSFMYKIPIITMRQKAGDWGRFLSDFAIDEAASFEEIDSLCYVIQAWDVDDPIEGMWPQNDGMVVITAIYVYDPPRAMTHTEMLTPGSLSNALYWIEQYLDDSKLDFYSFLLT